MQAVGTVLTQVDNNGRRRPIEFYSSGLSPAQRRYSAGELETWAIVAALRKWRVYLQTAQKVIIFTDHNPLSWLRRQKDTWNKYARWLLEIEAYNYDIEYRSGLQNGAADYLSRSACQFDANINDEVEKFEKNVYFFEAREFSDKIRDGQVRDEVIMDAVNQLEEYGGIYAGAFKSQGGMRVSSDGLLYRKGAITVPRDLQGEVTEFAHRLTHVGIERTYEYMRGRFFWIEMRKRVEHCCKSCTICLENKRASKKREPLRPIRLDVPEPRRFIAADVATLPWSENGYRYMLVIIDLFSKFAEVIPMREQTTEAICERWKSVGFTDTVCQGSS